MYYDSRETGMDLDAIIADKMRTSFIYLVIALVITFATSILTITNPTIYNAVFGSGLAYFVIILELIVGMALSTLAFRASKTILLVLLNVYAVLTGLTLSIFAFIYTLSSILLVLTGVIVLYTVLAVYGYTTKSNLSSYGAYLFSGLIALLIMSVINIFLKSSGFDFIITLLGVVIFVVYTAYTVYIVKEQTKQLVYSGQEELLDRMGVIGAFSLYLNFINLFIYMLRLFGRSRD